MGVCGQMRLGCGSHRGEGLEPLKLHTVGLLGPLPCTL